MSLASGRCLREKVATAVGVDSWRGAVSLMRRGQLKQTSITGTVQAETRQIISYMNLWTIQHHSSIPSWSELDSMHKVERYNFWRLF